MTETENTTRRISSKATEAKAPAILLFCGILSSILYAVANIVTAMQYHGYDTFSQTVSELSAIDTPTRSLWVMMMVVYSLLVIAFSWGLIRAGIHNRFLRIAGILLIVNSIIGFFWPPMHQREVLAAGGGTWSDTLHIAFTFITVPIMIAIIAFGAAALDKGFRIYSIITLLLLITAGIVTGIDAPNISRNMPTPYIGVWERVNIGTYMLWIIVFAVKIIKNRKVEKVIHSSVLGKTA